MYEEDEKEVLAGLDLEDDDLPLGDDLESETVPDDTTVEGEDEDY